MGNQQSNTTNNQEVYNQLLAMQAIGGLIPEAKQAYTESLIRRAQRNEDDIYLEQWPDTWPSDMKERRIQQWIDNHSQMTLCTLYGLLMQDGEYPWYGMNTQLCQAPIDPDTAPDPDVVNEFYRRRVPWAGVVILWGMDPRVVQRGIIKQEDINHMNNRFLHCPTLQLKLKVAAVEKLGSQAVTKLGDKLLRISNFQDQALESAGKALESGAKVTESVAEVTQAVAKGASESPLFSFTSSLALVGLGIILLVLKR